MNQTSRTFPDVSLLYVEDEEHTRSAVGELLRHRVSDVRIAKNGREALRYFRERKSDIVVTDIGMPVMGGLEVAREIRGLAPRTEIIVTADHDEAKYLLDVVDLGIGPFVLKPVQREELLAAVDRSALNILRERSEGERFERLEEMVLQRSADLVKTGEALDESLRKLRKAMQALIRAMAILVERRDPYTAGHQRKVARLARSLAEGLGLDRDRIDGVFLAGGIHDIGKISVPAEILSKPAGLTDLEFSLIRTHSEAGYDILKEIDFPWPIARIILQHHERLDGSGYPQGLSGEEILLEARIIAVADVVDAIASHRPYRPSLGLEQALEEISRNRGTLYDPPVVDTCLKLFRREGYRLA
jgi:response regulator RpfG family c-di-GMP phosphodiesterase